MALTISATEPRVQYTATSGQTSFSVPFEFFDNADLKVYNGTTLLTYNSSPSSASQYSVSGAGVSGGGSITLGGSGATLNDVITIYRDLEISRSTDFPTSGAFQVGSLNTELDKIIAMTQQLQRDLKFSPRAAATTANTYDITFPNLTANKVLSVNSAGNGLEFSQDITDITTIAGIASDVTTVSGIASNVTSVAGAVTNINTVASNITNVNTVASNIADIITVANDLNEAISEIETVASDLQEVTPEIDTVANNIVNVESVANNISNINAVATNATNINTVAGISSDISTVAADGTDIGTVAGISSDVQGVASISSAVSTVSSNIANIGTVAGANANINTIATDLNGSNTIGTVATDISNVNSVAGAITNVNSVATNLSSVNNFAEVYRISATAPTTSLDNGDLWFDTTAGKLKIWNGSSFELAGSSINGTSARFKYVATASQTIFSGLDANGETLAYDAGFIDVYLNGVHLDPSDYTATDGSTITLNSGATVNDELYIVGFGTFSVADISASNITSGTLNNARLTGSGAITINGSPVYLGGSVTVGETKPTISSISPDTITNSQTSIVITGTNFLIVPIVEAINASTGAITVADTISRDSSTQITVNFTLPTDGTYYIRVENPDGNAARSSTAILTVSDAPTWSTTAGSLGSLAQGDTASFSVSASSDSTVAYSVTSGALPTGLSLNSSTGAITGTESGSDSSETIYNFSITATDQESQTAVRAFSITVTTGINNGGQFN